MPVSGAQQASVQEMLQAAVHSMNMRPGSGPASSGRTGGASSFFSGSFNGQSPQNFDPPSFNSRRRSVMTCPAQTCFRVDVRASPSTRWPYGSAHPQTRRPSQSMTRMSQGQEHLKRVARKFRDTAGSLRLDEHYFFGSFLMYASSLSFSYLTVLRNRLSAR